MHTHSYAHPLALLWLIAMIISMPLIGFAHGAEDDGHEEPVIVAASDGHTDHDHGKGESALLIAFSTAWWGLLSLSLGLTILLSYVVYHYLQVPAKKVSPQGGG